MTPEQLNQTYQNLANAVNTTAQQGVTQINNAAIAKGKSLGNSGIGSYNYNRLVLPQENQLSSQLVLIGKQQILKKLINDAMMAAQQRYSNAVNSYRSKAASGTSSSGGVTTSGVIGDVQSGVKSQPQLPGSSSSTDNTLNILPDGTLPSGVVIGNSYNRKINNPFETIINNTTTNKLGLY